MFKTKLRKTDSLFSNYIRQRDKYTCQRCGHTFSPDNAQGLDNSHYWGRGRENTRFDSENCIALCCGCHRIWGGDGKDEYKAFMIKRLGQEGYDLLDVRAHTSKKKDDKLDMIILKELLKQETAGALID